MVERNVQFQRIKEKNEDRVGRKPKNKTCLNCEAQFHQVRDLLRHEKNRKDIECQHCNNKFCNNEHFQKHLRKINESTDGNVDYEVPINPKSGYEDDPEF